MSAKDNLDDDEGRVDGPTSSSGEGGHQLDRFQLVYEPSPIVPPDGGFGWVVVVAAFFVNLIADGVSFSFGILLAELFKSLDDSREDISWISAFLAGVPLLLGPITSLLIDRFGCRLVTLTGGLISGVGFALLFILPQSTVLYVLSGGLLAGFGLGLVYMPAVVAVSFYFLEKRALATGLAMSGSGVGTVVFAFIIRACIEEYTWRGSFLIIGGILMNVCICGALYRPLESADYKKMKRMNKLYVQFQANTQQQQQQQPSVESTPQHYPGHEGRRGSSTPSTTPPETPLLNKAAAAASDSSTAAAFDIFPATATSVPAAAAAAKSLLSIPTYLVDELANSNASSPQTPSPSSPSPGRRSLEKQLAATGRTPDEKQLIASLKFAYIQRLAAAAGPDSAECHNDALATVHAHSNGAAPAVARAIAKANTSHELVDFAKRISQKQKEEEQQQQQLPDQSKRVCLVETHQQHQQQQQQQAQRNQPKVSPSAHLTRKQIFPVDRRYFMQHARHTVGANTTIELWDSCPEFGRISASMHSRHNARKETRSLSLADLLRRFLKSKSFRDIKFLFTSWAYLTFLASNFLLYFWYDITYTFLPDHAIEIGLSNSDISMIIGLIGVTNTIGQIAIGYIGDFPSVDSALLYALCMSLTGVANILVPWCLNLASLLVYGIIYGFLVSANYSLCSIVLIDLFGLERLTTGYGFMMFFQGLANLVGTPAMGHMRDTDGNYNRAFIYSGIFVFASNLLIVPIYSTMYRSVRSCWISRRQPPNGQSGDTAEAEAACAAPAADQKAMRGNLVDIDLGLNK